MIPDWKGEKIMKKARKHVRYDDTGKSKGNYNSIHDKYLYEVEYPDGTMKQLAVNIIAENMLSQVDSEGHHYQVFTDMNDHKKDDSSIDKVGGSINYGIVNVHRKRTTCG